MITRLNISLQASSTLLALVIDRAVRDSGLVLKSKGATSGRGVQKLKEKWQ